MSFLAPGAFIFAAALPVVVVFYLLKRKRVVKLVSSTLLWQKFLAETQASAPFQRLRHNWLLILQLLMLALAIFELARPYFARPVKGGRLLVAVLDASASMQSADESPSRFEKSRAEVLQLINGLADRDQMVLLLAGAHTEVKQSPTGEKATLRRAVQACAVTDSPTYLTEALKLAETLTRDRPFSEIHLFSDGAASDLKDFEGKDLPLVYHRSGQRGNNAGIVGLDVRSNPENASQRAVFVSVANYSTNPVPTELELRFDGQLLETKAMTLPPTNTAAEVFIVAQPHDGVLSVRTTAKDDLAADDQASVVSLLPRPVRVLLVSRGNRFLEKAVRAAPNVELSLATDLTEAKPSADLVVLDDVAPTVWPAVNVLAIHCFNTNWFTYIGKAATPAIVDWKNTHPLMRFVTFDNVQIVESLAVKPPTWGLTLVDATETPLVVAGELTRQRIVWVGFDTLQSTWPLRISFPIFVANAVDWLNPASASSSQLMVKAGSAFHLGIVEAVTNADVTLPDGNVKRLAVDPVAREVVFGETTKQGVYQLVVGTNKTVFCVNLLDATESDTRPRPELKFGKYGQVAASSTRQANLELWRWIAAAALAMLLCEWWYYHRRTA